DEIFQKEEDANESTSFSSARSKTTLFVRKIPYDTADSEFEAFFSEIGPLRSCFTVKETRSLDATLDCSLHKDNTFNIDSSQPYTGKREQNRGFGFVQYVLSQDAERAIKELKKVKFRDQKILKLEFALKKHEKPPNIEKKSDKKFNLKKSQVEKTENKGSNRTLIVEGLPKDVTRKKIYEIVRKDAAEGLNRLDGHVFHGSKMNAKLLVKKKVSVDKKFRLIVRNIPWEYQESELLKIFSVHGEVVEVNLPRKYPNGPLRGFAYIQYKKVEEAERAINAMNETKHHGRTIAVDWSLPKDKYLKALKSQQSKHVCEQNNGCRIDSRAEENAALFVRNLSFEATEEELSDIFRPFGPLRYCVITRDDTTGRSRGTGFVCFAHKEHADTCLEEARCVNHIGFDSIERPGLSTNEKKRKGIIHKSVLTADPSGSQALKFTLHGRVLSVVKAVDKDEAHRLMEMNKNKRRKEDRRNTYLIKEGAVFPNTPDAALLPPSEVTKRAASFSVRKNLLAKNPNLFISKTRLSVRNLPLSIDEKKLKNLGKESIKKFKDEVKKGKRADLTKTEKMEGWDKLVHIKQAKIVRSKDRIDSSTKKLRSKGYGFLEFTQHSHALAALRYLNNNPAIFGEKKRLILEFATENCIIVKKRARLSKDRDSNVRGHNKADGNNSNGVEVTKSNNSSHLEQRNSKRKVKMVKSENQSKKRVKTS
ncbi:14009_t:CDS:10, partial [Racocetra persica]